MSLEQARAFIGRMKSDEAFRGYILTSENVEERLAKSKAEGFDCTLEDIEALQAICIDPRIPEGNLPLTWQCKGPCHDKCAAIA